MTIRTGGRGHSSGAMVDQLWTVAFRLRHAKIVRIEYHPSKEDALRAIGAP